MLGLEVSRLARNNADWYRLLDLCGMTDTLIGDADDVYHPAAFNDRLVLGLKGTMSEAELHILRARLDGGIRNKAARGELRRGLPLGLVWGERDGEIRFHPDEAVSGAIRADLRPLRASSAPRAASGSGSALEGLRVPDPRPADRRDPLGARRPTPPSTASWSIPSTPAPTSTAAPATSAASTSRVASASASVACPRTNGPCSCSITTPASSTGRPSRPISARIAGNTRPRPHQSGGVVREGAALLQGIATCGHCGRRLRTHYRGTRLARLPLRRQAHRQWPWLSTA